LPFNTFLVILRGIELFSAKNSNPKFTFFRKIRLFFIFNYPLKETMFSAAISDMNGLLADSDHAMMDT